MTESQQGAPRGALLRSAAMHFYSGPARHLWSGVDTPFGIPVAAAALALIEIGADREIAMMREPPRRLDIRCIDHRASSRRGRNLHNLQSDILT